MDFLALSLILLPTFFVIPSAFFRRILFIFSGIYLLTFIAPRLALIYIFFWTAVYFLHVLVAYAEKVSSTQLNTSQIFSKIVFWSSIFLTLLPMVIWKTNEWNFVSELNLLSNQGVGVLNKFLWEIDLARDIITPIGLSFATFRAIDLLVKTYIGKFKKLSIDKILFYGFFPPVLVVGPIIEYEEIEKAGNNPLRPDPKDILTGSMRIVWGFFKVLLLTSLLEPSAIILDHHQGQNTLYVWIYLFAYTWYFYLNFSGFSDIAIGLARLYGFTIKENFNNPFFKKNIIEFWSAWHMSLYRFARRNVFVPLGGYRQNLHLIALAGTMMTIALWHNLTASMLVFGLYHTAGLIAHRQFTAWRLAKGIDYSNNVIAQMTCAILTYLFVCLSFPLIVLPLGQAMSFYGALLGLR